MKLLQKSKINIEYIVDDGDDYDSNGDEMEGPSRKSR